MIEFDSVEYWKITTWDRSRELQVVRPRIREEFLRQENKTIETVVSIFRERGFLKILDLACGPGRISAGILASIGSTTRLTLVDFNEETLNKARDQLKGDKRVTFRCVDAYDIGDVLERDYDVVVSLDFLHHVSDMDSLLRGIHEVLKPDGILIANVLAAETYREWDRMKYGVPRSIRRTMFNYIAKRFYWLATACGRKLIRRYGFARIEPLGKEELLVWIHSFFNDIEVVSSYYHWFVATEREKCVAIE